MSKEKVGLLVQGGANADHQITLLIPTSKQI